MLLLRVELRLCIGLCIAGSTVTDAASSSVRMRAASMRAWYLDEYPTRPNGLNFSRAFPTPQPTAGELLISVKASSVNPIDYKILNPILHASFPLHFPTVLGFEGAGVVEAVAPQTSDRFKVGDEVWMDLGITYIGAYADYAVVPEALVSLKPQNLKFEEAATLPLVGLTSLQALEKANALQPLKGKTVLVLGGSGGTGFVAVQLAKSYFGASKVIATTGTDHIDLVKSFGADEVIDYHTSNWWDVVPNQTVDFVYDTVGQVGTGPRATRKLTDNGVFVTIVHKGPAVGLDPNPPPNTVQIYHKTEMKASWLDKLRGLVESGNLKPQVQRTYSLADLPKAWAESQSGHVGGKLAISMMTPQCSAHSACSELRGNCCPSQTWRMMECCYGAKKEL